MTIFEITAAALATLSPVPYAMGRMLTPSGAILPDTFIVYQVITAVSTEHYDNSEAARDYLVQVNTFSTSGLVNLPDVDSAMLAAGFTKNAGRQLPRDAQSGHYGWSQDYTYKELLP